MKILKNMLESVETFIKKHPALKRYYPIFEAADEFFFGTDKVTSLPHIMDGIDIKRYMSCAVLALIPATAAGIYFYGLRVLAVIAVSYAVGGLIEVIFSVVRKKPIYEGFLVTGLIFPLILPPSVPLWMVGVGVGFGVFFGKEVFGGTGRNIFNPALVGRVFLSLAFPEYFTTMWQKPLAAGLGGFVKYASDAVAGATPLINFKSAHVLSSLPQLLMGTAAGSIGETFRLGIILGGMFLIVVKITDWRIPLAFLGSVLVSAFIGHAAAPGEFAPPVFQILSGGLLFGVFFMATDPVTAPLTFEARWIYGALIGVLTVLIRALTGFAEGVMFAVLLMNAAGPFIDNIVVNIKFKDVGAA